MIDDFDQTANLKTDTKKYSKKKSLKTGLKKVATVLLYTALGLIVVPETANAIKIGTQHYKSDTQIFADAQYFDADMKLAKYFGQANFLTKTNFKRLPHNYDKPIYVSISDGFDENEKEMIQTVLNYYEELFTNINDHYKFKIVNAGEAYLQSLIGNNVLYYDEKDLSENGINHVRPNLFNFNFIKDSVISIKNMTDNEEKYYTIMHETAHAFGLGDIYDADTYHFDTFMLGSSVAHSVQMLYPNDVAMLYAMYSDNIRNGLNIDETKLLQAQNSFESYKDIFYEKTMLSLKEKYSYGNESAIDTEILNNKVFSFRMFNYNEKTNKIDEFVYKIQLNDEKNALFTIANKQNQILWQTTTRYDLYNGSIFLPSVYFSKGQYPSQDNTEEVKKSSEFFVIAKFNQSYQFFAPDSYFKITLSLNEKKLEMVNQDKIVDILQNEQKLENNIEL